MGRSAAATGAKGEKVWECLRSLRPLLPCCATGVRAGRTNGDGDGASDRLIAFCPQNGKRWETTKKWSNAFGLEIAKNTILSFTIKMLLRNYVWRNFDFTNPLLLCSRPSVPVNSTPEPKLCIGSLSLGVTATV